MASYFGKGAIAAQGLNPYTGTQAAAQPAAEEDKKSVCMQTCNERYQKDLDNPSVDYAIATQRYEACKASCQDIPAAQPVGAVNQDAGFDLPVKPPPGGGRNEYLQQCLARCQRRYEAKVAAGDPRQNADDFLIRCQQRCHATYPGGDDPVDPPPDEPCAGGIRADTDEAGVATCPDGYYKSVKAGVTWCCPQKGDEPTDPDAPEGCEQAYKIDKAFVGGVGSGSKPWSDPNGILPEGRFMRSPDWEGERVYDTETGLYYYTYDLQDFYQKKKEWPQGQKRVCKKGWIRNGQWCCYHGTGEEDDTSMGQFQWPEEIMELWRLLAGRGKDIMGMEPGFSEAEKIAMFGKDFDVLRSQGERARDTAQTQLQAEGLMGTGASQDLAKEMAWGTEQNVGDTMRDLFLADEAQKRQDLGMYTGLGQSIMDSLVGVTGGAEGINAARRQESMQSLALLLQYILGLTNAWG